MFDAKITVRSRLEHLSIIKGLLNGNRSELFRTTVFGQWLDIPILDPDNHLYDYFYQNAVTVPIVSDTCPPLTFKIGDNVLDFGRQEFCLVTGFRLGQVAKEETDVGRIVRGIPYSPFFDRLFPDKKATLKKRVKGEDLLTLMKNGPVWESILDVDAVRICLLVLATCVFIGREPRFYIPDHMLKMIEDLDVWNEYPWGEYMWTHLYKRTVNVVQRHINKVPNKADRKTPKKDETYVLYGFLFALKIWILESFPNSSQFYTKDPSKIPRALSWSKVKFFDKKHHFILFDQGVPPLKKLVPTQSEMKCMWYIRSMEYIRGLQMQLIVRDDEEIANPIPVSQVVPENMDSAQNANANAENANEVLVVETAPEAMDSAENANAENANKVPVAEIASNDVDVDVVAEMAEMVPEYTDDTGIANDVDVVDMVDEYMADDVGHEIHTHEDNVIEVDEDVVEKDVNDVLKKDVPEPSEKDATLPILDKDNIHAEVASTMSSDRYAHVHAEVASVKSNDPSDKGISEKDATLPRLNKDHIHAEVASIKSNVIDIEKKVGDVDVSYLLSEVAILKQRIGVVENVLGVKFEEKLVVNDVKCLDNDSQIKLKTADVNTPMKTNDSDDQKHNLYYTDPCMYTGPMTQLMKAVDMEFPHQDQSHNVIQVDVDNKFDCSSLPNLNEKFSDIGYDGFGQTPHEEESMSVDNQVKETEFEDKQTTVGDTAEEPDTVLADTICEAPRQVDDNVVQRSAEGCDNALSPEWEGATTDDNGVELICIDDDDDPLVVKTEKVRSIFNELKRKRKVGKYYKSPYTNPPDTTPVKLRRRSSRINNISPPAAPVFDDNLQVSQFEPFTENLSRARKSKPTVVSVPAYFRKWLKEAPPNILFYFPWGSVTLVDRRFWECIVGTGAWSSGWLRDEHIDVWVDLMWALRPSDADWAMAGGFFSACVMDGNIRSYWANGVKYPVPWCDVEKVLFPINQPRKHWALGELHIRTGVITIYDSFVHHSKKHYWWKHTMPETFGYWLPKYLKEEGVLTEKGVDSDGYAITWKYADNVPQQCTSYGDCGIWLCINLFRLGHKMSLIDYDPAHTALAYRERMLDYLWKQKIEYHGH